MPKSVVFDYYKVIYLPQTQEIDNEIIKILASLKRRGFPIYLFTNVSVELVTKMNKKVNFLKYFTNTVYNQEYPKPQREAFEKLINTVGTNPSDILLIDDTLINIQTAQQFGMTAIQYLGPQDLKNKLYEIFKNDN